MFSALKVWGIFSLNVNQSPRICRSHSTRPQIPGELRSSGLKCKFFYFSYIFSIRLGSWLPEYVSAFLLSLVCSLLIYIKSLHVNLFHISGVNLDEHRSSQNIIIIGDPLETNWRPTCFIRDTLKTDMPDW